MAVCKVIPAPAASCATGVGGIKKIEFKAWDDAVADQFTGYPTGFVALKIEEGRCNYSEVPSGAGKAVTQTVNIMLLEREANRAESAFLDAILSNRRIVCMVTGNDGNELMFGIDQGLMLTGGDTVSGANMGDFKGSNLVLTGTQKGYAKVN
jgi:hypothetical protein